MLHYYKVEKKGEIWYAHLYNMYDKKIDTKTSDSHPGLMKEISSYVDLVNQN